MTKEEIVKQTLSQLKNEPIPEYIISFIKSQIELAYDEGACPTCKLTRKKYSQ